MPFPRLNPIGDVSPSKQPSAHKSTISQLLTTINYVESSVTVSASQASSLRHPGPPDNQPLSWTAKLFQRQRAKKVTSNLGIGPSGAVVCKGHRSVDSLFSTSTAGSGSANFPAQPKKLIISRSSPSLHIEKRKSIGKIRSHSQDSLRSVAASNLRRRSYEKDQPRLPNFLGRHPPPLQRRSISLPLTTLHEISENPRYHKTERELLFIGDDPTNTLVGYTKVPRLVPQRIQRDNYDTMLVCKECFLRPLLGGKKLCEQCVGLLDSQAANFGDSDSEASGCGDDVQQPGVASDGTQNEQLGMSHIRGYNGDYRAPSLDKAKITIKATSPSKMRGFFGKVGKFFRAMKPKKK